MLPNTSNLSNQAKFKESYSGRKTVRSKLDGKDKNKVIKGILLDREKAENAVWQGIKAEKKGDLKKAASQYRLALEYEPECAKAYRLLCLVLNKNCELKKRSNQTDIKLLATGEPKAETKSDRHQENIENNKLVKAENSQIVRDNRFNFCDVNLVSSRAFDVNNTNSSSQTNSEIVLLPNMQASPSGDLVLQDNLAVSQVYMDQATVFFEKKQWEKSIAACQEALRICPNMGEAYKIWGNCLQQSGNSAEAIGIYAKALELQPNMAEIYCNLGSIYAKSQKWQQAIEHYQKSIAIDPDFAAPCRNLARVWDELGEYDKSEEYFFKAITIKPKLITAKNHFDLAHNLATENKPDRAISCYKNCIQLDPNFLNAYVRLAQLLEESGQKEEALYYYKKLAQLQTEKKAKTKKSKSKQQIHEFLFGTKPKSAKKSSAKVPVTIKKNTVAKALPQSKRGKFATKQEQINEYLQKTKQKPNSAPLRYEIGNLYAQIEQWQNAITYYLQAIKIAPGFSKYYFGLGQAWSKLGDTVKANQSFYQAFSLEPEKVKAQNHLMLGNKLLEQRQSQLAIACYRRAITQDPKIIESYWQLGKILLSSGNEQGAIACYQQALKIEPDNSRSYFYLANALAQTKQTQPAVDCYQKAAEIDPNNADIKHNLGEMFFQQENWQDAAGAYRQAIALNPHNSWSYNNLGDVLIKLEQWQEAANSFRSAIALKPDFVWSYYNLGEALVELAQWDEALAAYQKAKQLDPQLPRVKQKIANILRRRSKNSQHEALSWCKVQIQEDPNNIELYHQAIALDRKDCQLYLGLGKALFEQKKWEEAISIFQMGLEIEPENPELASEWSKAIYEKDRELNFEDVPDKAGDLNDR